MSLKAGAARRSITPEGPVFLVGYPHVPRLSTGVHDELEANVLYLEDARQQILLVSVDLLFVTRQMTRRIRERLRDGLGIPPEGILVAATHTHSGPVTSEMLAWRRDPVVPPPDPNYVQCVEDAVIEAAREAVHRAVPAELVTLTARASGLGGNRLDAAGPCDPDVPLLVVRSKGCAALLALCFTVAMHPTVLHEDSTLVSRDFTGLARRALGEAFPTAVCLGFMGAAGNQSPRRAVRANTLEEAERLGRLLAGSIREALAGLIDRAADADPTLGAELTGVRLPPRSFPDLAEARRRETAKRTAFEALRAAGAPRAEVRTAECAWFGAEEVVTLSEAQENGELAEWVERHARVEVQVLRIGNLAWVAWPAEVFVEYGLQLKQAYGRPLAVVTLANGESQGYLVTPEADRSQTYEAQCSLFTPEAGAILVETSLCLLSAAIAEIRLSVNSRSC